MSNPNLEKRLEGLEARIPPPPPAPRSAKDAEERNRKIQEMFSFFPWLKTQPPEVHLVRDIERRNEDERVVAAGLQAYKKENGDGEEHAFKVRVVVLSWRPHYVRETELEILIRDGHIDEAERKKLYWESYLAVNSPEQMLPLSSTLQSHIDTAMKSDKAMKAIKAYRLHLAAHQKCRDWLVKRNGRR